jgi:endonuclease III
MLRKDRVRHFIEYFLSHSPQAQTELVYSNPYELLVAVILSAQCTDKRINQVTPGFFSRFPSPEVLGTSHFDEVFPYIKSVSYPNNKTKHLLGMARMLTDDFGGRVPDDIKDLQKLPGVGRKTANVIASVVYDQPAMAVDTHVFRVSKRLGLVNQNCKTPFEVEKQLLRHIPQKYVSRAHHWLILHGRYICLARSPKCDECPLTFICRFYEKQKV